MGKRGLRSIGIRKVTPNQIDFRRPISGSISFHQTTTPDTVNSGLGNLYIKSDGKLYFKSFMFEETDLLAGGGGGGSSINGLSVALTTNTLSIESDANYGDTDTDGGDFPDPIPNGPSAKIDISVVGSPSFTTTGHDFSHSSLGSDPTENTYKIDASNTTATTDSGVVLATSLTGHEDDSPTDFTIDFKNAAAGNKIVMKIGVTVDSNDTKLTLKTITQHVDDSTTVLKNITVNVPFKINIAGNISTITRTFTVQKIRTGQEGLTAKTVNIRATKIAFKYDGEGANPVGTATLTAEAINTGPTTTVFYEFFDITGDTQFPNQPVQALNSGTATANFTPQASINNMPRVIEVRLRETSDTNENTIIARDQITMIGIEDGTSPYQLHLTNGTHTIPAQLDNQGNPTVLNFAGSNPGALAVFRGGTRLTLDTNDPTGNSPATGKFSVTSVVSPSSNITGLTTTPSVCNSSAVCTNEGVNKDAVFSDHTGMGNVNVGQVIYTVNAESKATLSIVQTITKSIEGAAGQDGPKGDSGRAVELAVASGGKPVVEFGPENEYVAGTTVNQVVIVATARNTTGTLAYSFTIDDGTVSADSTQHSVSGNQLTYKIFTSAGHNQNKDYTDFPKKIEVSVTEDGTEVARDQLTLISIKPGSGAYRVSMPNNNTSVISDELNGGTLDLSTTGDTIRVFKGNVQLTPIDANGSNDAQIVGAVNPTLGQYSITARQVTDGNITMGALTIQTNNNDPRIEVAAHSNMSSERADITYTFNFENLASTAEIQSIAKSIKGANGTSISGVDLEVDPLVIIYNEAGGSPSASTVRLTATPRGVGTEARVTQFGASANTYARNINPNGTSQGIDLDASANFTMAFWIKFNDDEDFNNNLGRLQRIIHSTELQLYVDGFDLVFKYQVTTNPVSTVTHTRANFFNASDAGEWIQVIVSRNANRHAYFGKNGKFLSVIAPDISHSEMKAMASLIYLGNEAQSSNNNLDAQLSNFLIYSVYLSTSLYDELYNSGFIHADYSDSSMPNYQHLKIWWKLDEEQPGPNGNLVAINDSSGRNRHLNSVSGLLTSVASAGIFIKTGPAAFTFKVNGTVVGSANQSLPYVDFTSIPAQFSLNESSKTVTVELRPNGATDTQKLRDRGSIISVKEGTGGLTFAFNNPNHFFQGDANGAVSDYSKTGTTLQVLRSGKMLEPIAHNAALPTPASGGKYKITSITVSPNNIITPAAQNSYTISDEDNDSTNDTITIPDHTAGTSPFSSTQTFGQVIYTLNIDGTEAQAIQNFSVAQKGATGQDGSDVGIQLVLTPPIAIIQTDRYGHPLTGDFSQTAATLKVVKQGVKYHLTPTSATTALTQNAYDAANPASSTDPLGFWHIKSSGINADGLGNALLGTGINLPTTHLTYNSTTDVANLQPILGMDADVRASFRSITCTVNVDGQLYKPTVVQQIIKVVGQVETLTPQITKPVVQIIRSDYTTIEPTISSYSQAECAIKLWKQTGVNPPEIVPVAANNNATNPFTDENMPNNSYKLMPSSTGNNLFSLVNVTRGTPTYKTGTSSRISIGAPSGYNNNNFPEPMKIDYQLKYKDTVGNFHFIPLTQTLIPMDEAPPQNSLKLYLFHRFDGNVAHMKDMEDLDGVGDTFVFARGDTQIPHGYAYVPGRIQTHNWATGPQTNRLSNTDSQSVAMTSYPSRFGPAPYYVNNARQWVTGNDQGDGNASTTNNPRPLANEATVFYPGKACRFTGTAIGQLYLYSLNYAATSNRQWSFGVDLYKFQVPGFQSTVFNINYQPQYLATLKFGAHHPSTYLGSAAGAIGGNGSRYDINNTNSRVDTTIEINSLTRYTSYSSFDTSNAIYLSSLDAVMMVFYIDRYHLQGNTHRRIPNAGFLRMDVDLGYYILE